MEFSDSSILTPHLITLNSTGSTNDELRKLAESSTEAELPHFSVVVTLGQSDGRGRLGRTWSAPYGTSLAVSILLRRGTSFNDDVSFIPLLAGLAMTRAVRHLGVDGHLKWPNDVLVADRKLSGILCERIHPELVIVGAGLNVSFTSEQAPVPTATSLAMEGISVDPDAALSMFLREFRDAYRAFEEAGPAKVRDDVTEVCSTIGMLVKIELPGGDTLRGRADSLDERGRLVIDSDGRRTAVSAGDVTHLRY